MHVRTSGLIFCELEWFGQGTSLALKGEKNISSIFLRMRVTIPGTHGIAQDLATQQWVPSRITGAIFSTFGSMITLIHSVGGEKRKSLNKRIQVSLGIRGYDVPD
jgi:hypothetical protein